MHQEHRIPIQSWFLEAVLLPSACHRTLRLGAPPRLRHIITFYCVDEWSCLNHLRTHVGVILSKWHVAATYHISTVSSFECHFIAAVTNTTITYISCTSKHSVYVLVWYLLAGPIGL